MLLSNLDQQARLSTIPGWISISTPFQRHLNVISTQFQRHLNADESHFNAISR